MELCKPVDSPRKPKRKSGEAEDDWKHRVTMYKAKLTNWSTKTEEANQKYRENRHLSCEEEAPSCSLSAVCVKEWCLAKSACQ